MERSDELRTVVQRYYDAMASGDHATIALLTCRHDGVLAIGTDPNEWWDGYEENVRVFEDQMADWHGGIPIVGGEIEAFVDGNVGWFADRPYLHLPDGTDVVMRRRLARGTPIWPAISSVMAFRSSSRRRCSACSLPSTDGSYCACTVMQRSGSSALRASSSSDS